MPTILVALLFVSSLFAAPCADGETAFLDGLAQVESLMRAGRWDKAGTRLTDLVSEHEGADYVVLELSRVLDLLRTCRFRATHEAPEADDLISGEILSYSSSTGKIKVRYRRADDSSRAGERSGRAADGKDGADGEDGVDGEDGESGISSAELEEFLQLLGLGSSVGRGDFEWRYGVPVHPIHFAGPYTVELSGFMPEPEGNTLWFFGNPQFLVGIDEDSSYLVNFGLPKWQGFQLDEGGIEYRKGSQRKMLERADNKAALKFGKPYTIKVNVSKDTITATVNGKTFLKCKKQDETYGQFGFRGCPQVKEMVISGDANKAWLEGLQDAALQKALVDFDAEWSPRDELPEWLHAYVADPADVGRSVFADAPSDAGPLRSVHQGELVRFEKEGQDEEALAYVGKLEVPRDGGPLAKAWMRAVLLDRLGRADEALAELDTLASAEPAFVPGRLLRARLLRRLERSDEAVADVRALVAGEGADDPRAHAELVRQLLWDGDLEQAQQVLDAARLGGRASPELVAAASLLHRSRSGPSWLDPFEFSSRHYRVMSDLDLAVCADTSKVLEQALAMDQRVFGRSDSDVAEQGLFPVYLFAGEAGYHAYTRDVFGSAARFTAGLYTPTLRQLVLWNLPDRELLYRTVRHEGMHQYLHRALPVTPPWFDEGLGEYVETARLVRGTMEPGDPLPAHVALLTDRDTKWTPLPELVRMSQPAFMTEAGLHYAESWALVHWMLHGGSEARASFDAYKDALARGLDRLSAADEAFGPGGPEGLEAKVRAHLQSLR
ncbi:MAG: DUF1570 domain-containing protein [Planctomycetes bacterium]|nr:DUF1570 domain-containing protein [Planctomycetota bacterium]